MNPYGKEELANAYRLGRAFGKTEGLLLGFVTGVGCACFSLFAYYAIFRWVWF